jgi:hypothetical protein
MVKKPDVKNPDEIIQGFEAKQKALRKKVWDIFVSHDAQNYVTTADILLSHFQEKCSPGGQISRTINQIILTQYKGDYFLVYDVLYSASDRLGNPIHADERIGVAEIPIIRNNYKILADGTKIVTDATLDKIEKEYFIRFAPETLDSLKPYLGEDVSYIVKPSGSGGRRYGGFTFNEIRNTQFETLVHIGQFGRLPDIQYRAQAEQAKQQKVLSGEGVALS